MPGIPMFSVFKVYDFSITTSTWSTGSTAFYPAQYAVSGLTTNDIPIALIPSTALWAVPLVGLAPASSTAGLLNVLWGGNSTTATAAGIANKMGATLLTIAYYTQASSTTT